MTELDQSACVAAGATGRVERRPGGRGREQLADDRLLDRDDRVAGLVVGVGPDRVAGGGVLLGCRLCGAEGRIIEHTAKLLKALLSVGIRAVVEVAQQRQTLDSGQQFSQ